MVEFIIILFEVEHLIFIKELFYISFLSQVIFVKNCYWFLTGKLRKE